MELEETQISPLHEQGEDESEFTITRVAEEAPDWDETVQLDCATHGGDFDETVQLESVEDLASTRRRATPAPFDRDGRFALDRDALLRIHGAIDDALAGAPLSSVPSVDASRNSIPVPAPSQPTSMQHAGRRSMQLAVTCGCAFAAVAATTVAVLTLFT